MGLTLGGADDALAAQLPALATVYRHAARHLEQSKREARLLDFTDLLVRALSALDHPHVREDYSARWWAFLIDEGQDTNPLQARFLKVLSEHATLTLVGDEKQSIYGFLGADEAVFGSLQRRIHARGGREVALSACFHMHTSLLAQLNAATAPLLADRHQPLTATRSAPGEGPHVTVWTVTSEEKTLLAAQQVTEARQLATLINDLVAARTPVFDKDTGQHRPVELRDIAVLTRVWKPLDTYSEVLPSLGVRVVHSGGGSLLDTREAKDALAALLFLSDPHDDLALAAVLRGPTFALDDRTLSEIARHAQGSRWWSWSPDRPTRRCAPRRYHPRAPCRAARHAHP